MDNNLTQEELFEERKKYVNSFNDTMLKIWKERIVLLGVMDTKQLLHSLTALPVRADGRFVEIGLSQAFLEYGLFQDYGTGREVYRGNPGDIGRTKVRERRRWFSTKYFASVMNIRDFMADNLGREFCGIVSDAIKRRHKLN